MKLNRLIAVALVAFALVWAVPSPATAEFTRTLQTGDTGEDVTALQLRVAGWFPRADQRRLKLTGIYDQKTANAVKALETHYRLEVDGIADEQVFALLAELEDDDGSTTHFDFGEFDQNYNSQCSKEANRYAGTFKGGLVSNKKVREYVVRLMWRLEALRAKNGDKPIGISSGFRSVAYNECIGGAGLSQHLFGAAADLQIAEVHNHDARASARGSQFSGIACYSGFNHNHVDIRLDNEDLEAAWYWYWPATDHKGREYADDGLLCKGEKAYARQNRFLAQEATLSLPTRREVKAFQHEHDDFYGGLAD